MLHHLNLANSDLILSFVVLSFEDNLKINICITQRKFVSLKENGCLVLNHEALALNLHFLLLWHRSDLMAIMACDLNFCPFSNRYRSFAKLSQSLLLGENEIFIILRPNLK
ncbi:hypothetical protein AABB24_011251 [Solanum stoloniferum]|uniref:Uncharacterized protein n=1 Tax=Solanum stoloniferum TaxID=62892 RepID=A0ABD2UCI3_9SOLN